MKAACIVAFLTFSAFEASAEVQKDTQAGTEAEAAEACQSGSLIQQRLASSHTVLPETESTPDLGTATAKKAKHAKPLEKNRVAKRQRLEQLQKFLAESKMQVPEPPTGSECNPTGAELVGESRAEFELLSQKVSALDLDAVIARLVEKGDYEAKKAKRAADEYRKFLVLMGMGKTPVASKMVLDAWQAHVMYTKMYEQDCETVFGHFLEHDPLEQKMDEGQLEQTKQQICDYFGRVDPVVWAKPSKAAPAVLSQSTNTDPAEAAKATMEEWLDHINEKRQLRQELVTEDVHLMVASQHQDRAVTFDGSDSVLSFFHRYGHATMAREFLSVEPGAFAIEMTKNLRMGAQLFKVDAEGKVFDIKIFLGSLRNDQEDLNDPGLTLNVTSGLGPALVQAGQTDVSVTKATMDAWMQSLNEPGSKEALLASDVRVVLQAQSDMTEPETHQGRADVMKFFEGWEPATAAREFLSVDGGAFMIEVNHDTPDHPHPRLGIQVVEVNPDGKIQDIKIWVGSMQGDAADLHDDSLTAVASLAQSRSHDKPALSAGALHKHAECQKSGSPPSLQQMRSFNASAKKVQDLDMAAVVAVLVQRDGYSPGKAAELAEEYRKYLALVGTGLQPVPSKKVDDAWHAHILNTKKYAADTKALFGHVLHHEPANLLLNEQGLKEQKSSMDNMFTSTKTQICDYYGRVNEDAWAKEDVTLCICSCGCGCGCACSCGCGTGC